MNMMNFIDFEKFSKQINDMQNTAYSNVDIKKAQDVYESLIREAADVRVNLEKSNAFFADYLISLLDGAVESLNKVYDDFKKCVEKAKKENPVTDIVNKEVQREVNENHGKVNVKDNMEKVTDTCECKEHNGSEIEYPSSKLTSKQRRSVYNIVSEYMEEMILPYLPEDYDEDIVDDAENGLIEFAAWLLNK